MSAIRAFKVPQTELAPEEQQGTDLTVLLPTLVLVGLGIAMVFSASIPMAAANESEDIYYYLWREIAFALVGGLGMWVASRISMQKLQRQAGTLLFLAAALLVAVLVAGVRVNGAKSWFAIPGTGLRFQPSEFAKLALVIAAARYFAKFPMGLPNWRRALSPLLTLGAVAGLIAVEPDMGTAAVLVLAMLIYFHIAGVKLSHLAGAGAVGLAGAAVMILHHPYQIQRLIGFVKRTELPLAEGYQATQSLIALGSGGITGRGYCGSVWKYFYLPAAITDSILSVIGEELGLIATWMVVCLFAVLVWRGMVIAGRAPNRFSGLVAAGVTCLLGVQALLNIAVATHTVPSTGVPLPLVSYGGSSLVFSLIGVGLLLNVSRRQLRKTGEPTAT
jgi:cell division protein FtsW